MASTVTLTNYSASGKPVVWENAESGRLHAVMNSSNSATVPITGSIVNNSSVSVVSDTSSGSIEKASNYADSFRADNGFLMTERTDPSAPSSNRGHLYVRDNGSGKTQLCVRFPTGAVQTIATEP